MGNQPADPNETLHDPPTAVGRALESDAELASSDTQIASDVGVPIDAQIIRETNLGQSPQRYETRKLLGAGGMGEVRLCKDHRIGRDIAVKTMHARIGASTDSQARFLREARVQGQLEHPNVVPVYDLGVDGDGSMFFTMKRVRGQTLDEVLHALRRNEPGAVQRWSRRKLLTAFASVSLTLDYAHSRGVIHRDLKPGNIMFGEFGEVHVLDWGLAKIVGVAEEQPASDVIDTSGLPASGTHLGALMGTPGYMAPEQARGLIDELDARTDVYALGAILFEMLTLKPLHEGKTVNALLLSIADGVDARASIRAPQAEIPPELDAICVKATATDPAQRFPSARALSDAIERFLDGDRDLQRRRELAGDHARRANEAVAKLNAGGGPEAELRAEALRESGRAVALDPTHIEAMGIAARLLMDVPSQLPETAEREWDASRQQTLRAGARAAAVRSITWIAFVPLLLMMGVRNMPISAVIVAAIAVTIAWAFRMSRMTEIRPWHGAALLFVSTLALASISGIVGPFVIVPGLVSTGTLLTAFHADKDQRRTAITFGIAAVIVPALLDLAHLLPPAYTFVGDAIVINARAVHLPPLLTSVLLIATSVSLVLTPAFLAGRTRDALVAAERRLFAHAWQLRQLMPEGNTR